MASFIGDPIWQRRFIRNCLRKGLEEGSPRDIDDLIERFLVEVDSFDEFRVNALELLDTIESCRKQGMLTNRYNEFTFINQVLILIERKYAKYCPQITLKLEKAYQLACSKLHWERLSELTKFIIADIGTTVKG